MVKLRIVLCSPGLVPRQSAGDSHTQLEIKNIFMVSRFSIYTTTLMVAFRHADDKKGREKSRSFFLVLN